MYRIFRLDIGGSIKPHSFYRRITDDYFDAYENIIGMFASSNNVFIYFIRNKKKIKLIGKYQIIDFIEY